MAPQGLVAKGSIAERPLASVLLALLRAGHDGCLTVTRSGITRRLYLRGGMIVHGSSTKRADRLGEILIAQGKLSRDDHRRYWEESRSGSRKLGITLVLNGVITLPDLYQAVTAQVVTILDRLQKMRSGEFSFEAGKVPGPGTVLLRIPLALYLRTDGARRAGQRAPATGREAAVTPAAPARGAGREEEVLVVRAEDLSAGPAISFEEARRIECVGAVSFLVQELRGRRGQGPHELLGIAADAPFAAVKAAFEQITRVLGPESIPAGCPPALLREAAAIHEEAAAAFHAIAESRLRAERAQAPPPPQRVATKAEEDPSRRYWAIGRDWFARRNFWQAADALRQAVRLRPDDAAFRQQLGLALMQIRRLPEAEEHLVEAARLDPGNPAHFVALGRIYAAGRLYRKAREAFQRAQRLDPANRHARAELAALPDDLPPERRGDSGLLRKIFGKG